MSHIISFVQSDEYDKVLNENIMLKAKIAELYTTINQLHETIKTDKLTIDLLKEENEMLKEKIKSLEDKILKQDIIIQELKTENVQLKEEIKELKAENVQLKSDINDLKLKDVYNSYIMAIQDTNSYQRLELTLPKHKKNLNKLRRNRNVSCHYIEEKEDEMLKTNKLYVLYDKLINMDTLLRSKFDKEFPYLIQDLIQYIEPLKTVPSEDELENISYWWE